MKHLKLSLASTCALVALLSASHAWAEGDADSAYTLNLVFTGELWDNVSGGIKTGTSFMDNADARFAIDTGKAYGWTGGNFVLEGFYANARSTGSQYVGALDQQSPIDTAITKPTVKLYQAYYDQKLGNTDVLFGKVDVESEFSVTKPMSLFLSKNLTWNTAFDQSGTMPQNGTTGPGNYPYTPLAVRVRQTINSDFSVALAVADAVSDDPSNLSNNGLHFGPTYGETFLGEADYTPDRYTKAMVGAWGLDSKLTDYGTSTAVTTKKIYGEEGGYVGGATRLYYGEGRRGLDAFFTLGVSSPKTTNVAESLNGGLTYTGLFDLRPQDKIGVSFNINEASSDYKTYEKNAFGTSITSSETSLELTYRAKLNDWVTVQPDVQYIINPNYGINPNSTTKALKNDTLIGLHFEVGHFFDL